MLSWVFSHTGMHYLDKLVFCNILSKVETSVNWFERQSKSRIGELWIVVTDIRFNMFSNSSCWGSGVFIALCLDDISRFYLKMMTCFNLLCAQRVSVIIGIRYAPEHEKGLYTRATLGWSDLCVRNMKCNYNNYMILDM